MVFSVLKDNGEEFHWSIVKSTHTVRLCGIEIDAVTGIQYESLLANGEFESAFSHEVELLSLVGIGMQRMIVWFGLHRHHKRVGCASTESAGKTLVFVLLAT